MKIEGWNNDTVYILAYSQSSKIDTMITTTADNGCVTFDNFTPTDTVELSVSAKCSTVARQGSQVPLFLEAPTIHTVVVAASREGITGRLEGDRVTYRSKGSLPIFAQMAALHSIEVAIKARKDANEQLIERNPSDERLFDLRHCYNDTLRQAENDFIASNPDSDLSARLTVQSRLDDFDHNYSLLGDKAKSGLYASLLLIQKQRTDAYHTVEHNRQLTEPGNAAPLFTLPSIDAESVSLESLRGKWVILDFWGSWCSWCIKGFPELKQFYADHGGKVEVVGIDCNDADADWRKAVADNDLQWINIADDGSVNVAYAIEAFPTKVVIDTAGVIRMKVVGEDPDFYANLADLLSSNR